MRSLLILPILLGAAAVLQGTLNAKVAQSMGLSGAVVLNGVSVLAISLGAYALVRAYPTAFPASFLPVGGLGAIKAWFPLVGLLGFAFVWGLPWAFERLGAFPVVMGLLVSQLVVGLLWDRFLGGQPITPAKLAGGALAILAAWLVNRG